MSLSAAETAGRADQKLLDDLRDLRVERDRFVGFAFAAAELLIEVTPENRIAFAAGAVKAVTGADTRSVIGQALRGLFAESDRRLVDLTLDNLRRKGRSEPLVLAMESAGKATRVTLTGCQLPGKVASLYLAINRTRTQGSSIEDDASRDSETGLLNGDAFRNAVAELVASEDRTDELALTLVELGGLEDLRKRSGDSAVTALMREMGAFLRVHATDGNAAGRLAQDKFGVVRTAAASGEALKPEIEKLAQACDRNGKVVTVTEVDLPLDPTTLSPADAARALAYTLGRFVADSVQDFTVTSLVEGFRSQIAETVGQVSRLKAAVLEKKIEVAFQPIVNLQDRSLHHYEMLARFERNVSPFQLINFAEQIGLIEDFDLLICQRGIGVLESMSSKQMSIAINISGRSLGSDLFVAALMSLFEAHAAVRDRVLFEVTESTGIKDLPRAGRILAQLRSAGHGICLDDFGAGASSFPYLQALPIDHVKIDGAYVERMAASRKDRSILVAMVALCRDLEIGTIAEMVEYEDQAATLKELGVDYGQGYLFGRPTLVPTETMVANRTR